MGSCVCTLEPYAASVEHASVLTEGQ